MNVLRHKVAELWNFREMFQALVSREIRARYKGSFFGFFWSLLNPLLMMIVYSLIFSQVIRIQVPHYSLHLLAALLPWTWFTTSISNATGAIVANANLIKKVYFPNELLPTVAVTTNLINYLYSIPVIILFMLFQHVPITPMLLFLPLLLAVQFVLTLGMGLWLSTLNVFFRDVEQLLGVVLMAWFYLTPIVYPREMIPERFQELAMLNPLSGLVVSYQNIFMQGTLPDFRYLLYDLGVGVVLLLLGYVFFLRHRFDFAEVI